MALRTKTEHKLSSPVSVPSMVMFQYAPLAFLLCVSSAVAQQDCGVIVVGNSKGGCVQFNITGLPHVESMVSDGWPEPYLVGTPCHPATQPQSCKACATQPAAMAFQLTKGACSGE